MAQWHTHPTQPDRAGDDEYMQDLLIEKTRLDAIVTSGVDDGIWSFQDPFYTQLYNMVLAFTKILSEKTTTPDKKDALRRLIEWLQSLRSAFDSHTLRILKASSGFKPWWLTRSELIADYRELYNALPSQGLCDTQIAGRIMTFRELDQFGFSKLAGHPPIKHDQWGTTCQGDRDYWQHNFWGEELNRAYRPTGDAYLDPTRRWGVYVDESRPRARFVMACCGQPLESKGCWISIRPQGPSDEEKRGQPLPYRLVVRDDYWQRIADGSLTRDVLTLTETLLDETELQVGTAFKDADGHRILHARIKALWTRREDGGAAALASLYHETANALDVAPNTVPVLAPVPVLLEIARLVREFNRYFECDTDTSGAGAWIATTLLKVVDAQRVWRAKVVVAAPSAKRIFPVFPVVDVSKAAEGIVALREFIAECKRRVPERSGVVGTLSETMAPTQEERIRGLLVTGATLILKQLEAYDSPLGREYRLLLGVATQLQPENVYQQEIIEFSGEISALANAIRAAGEDEEFLRVTLADALVPQQPITQEKLTALGKLVAEKGVSKQFAGPKISRTFTSIKDMLSDVEKTELEITTESIQPPSYDNSRAMQYEAQFTQFRLAKANYDALDTQKNELRKKISGASAALRTLIESTTAKFATIGPTALASLAASEVEKRQEFQTFYTLATVEYPVLKKELDAAKTALEGVVAAIEGKEKQEGEEEEEPSRFDEPEATPSEAATAAKAKASDEARISEETGMEFALDSDFSRLFGRKKAGVDADLPRVFDANLTFAGYVQTLAFQALFANQFMDHANVSESIQKSLLRLGLVENFWPTALNTALDIDAWNKRVVLPIKTILERGTLIADRNIAKRLPIVDFKNAIDERIGLFDNNAQNVRVPLWCLYNTREPGCLLAPLPDKQFDTFEIANNQRLVALGWAYAIYFLALMIEETPNSSEMQKTKTILDNIAKSIEKKLWFEKRDGEGRFRSIIYRQQSDLPNFTWMRASAYISTNPLVAAAYENLELDAIQSDNPPLDAVPAEAEEFKRRIALLEMLLDHIESNQGTLSAAAAEHIDFATPFQTPWRLQTSGQNLEKHV